MGELHRPTHWKHGTLGATIVMADTQAPEKLVSTKQTGRSGSEIKSVFRNENSVIWNTSSLGDHSYNRKIHTLKTFTIKAGKRKQNN